MAGEHVWAIDDDRIMRILMKEFLKGRDYVPTCFKNAELAMKALKAGEVEKPRAMLVDMVLPGMWGTELITAARPYLSNGNHCAFYLVTGHEKQVPENDPQFADVTIFTKPMDLYVLKADLEKTVRSSE